MWLFSSSSFVLLIPAYFLIWEQTYRARQNDYIINSWVHRNMRCNRILIEKSNRICHVMSRSVFTVFTAKACRVIVMGHVSLLDPATFTKLTVTPATCQRWFEFKTL